MSALKITGEREKEEEESDLCPMLSFMVNSAIKLAISASKRFKLTLECPSCCCQIRFHGSCHRHFQLLQHIIEHCVNIREAEQDSGDTETRGFSHQTSISWLYHNS